jgi:hypothetical protein
MGRRRPRNRYALHADELGAGELTLSLAVTRLFKDWFECSHLLGFLKKQANGFFRFFKAFCFDPPHEDTSSSSACAILGTAFFENTGCKLDYHGCLTTGACTGRIASMAVEKVGAIENLGSSNPGKKPRRSFV